MEQPVIFLDVDGVLNAVQRHDPAGIGFRDFKITRCMGFKINHSLEMGRQLMELGLEVLWLTTWGDDDYANRFIRPLFGWEPFGVLWSDECHGWWKSYAAQEYLAENPRPFIWLDDDLSDAVTEGEVEWLRDTELPHLIISPNARIGLTPAHLNKIEEFLHELEDR